MLNNINFLKLKNIILKYFKNQRICIELKVIINTRFFIDNSKIIINKSKIVIANNEKDFTMELMNIKKMNLKELYHLEFLYDDFAVILEV